MGSPEQSGIPFDGRPKKQINRRALIIGAAGLPILAGAATVTGIALQPLRTSVEVFDIENLTGHESYQYFCKGMTSELMRNLTHVTGIKIIPVYTTRSRASSRRIARFSLAGIMQAQNEQIRLTIQLQDNRDATLVWSENFDRRQIGDPLALQTDIARGTIIALQTPLLSTQLGSNNSGAWLRPVALGLRQWLFTRKTQDLPKPPTYSNEAFDLYMRGHSLLEDLSPDSASAAVDYFKQAISADKNFALAYSAVADAQLALLNYEVAPRPGLLESSLYYAEQAVQRDSTLAEGHMVRGAVRQDNWDWSGAEASYQQALQLKPTLARARRWYAGLILQFRRFDESIEAARKALDQDPYDRSAPAALGMYLTLARRYSEALRVLQQALVTKDMFLTRLNLAQLFACLGHSSSGIQAATYYAQALKHVGAAAVMERSMKTATGVRAYTTDPLFALYFVMSGNHEAAEPYLQRSTEAMQAGTLSPVLVAKVHAALGNNPQAIDLLFQAASWKDRRLLYINISPFFDPLRTEPRFRDLLRQMQV